MKIKEYLLVQGRGGSQEDRNAISAIVNDHLRQGWVPFPGLTTITDKQTGTIFWQQALVKYETDEKSPQECG